ncbi:MAG: hypothetical protein U0872_05055 [Planctomycetaceae bacterium]
MGWHSHTGASQILKRLDPRLSLFPNFPDEERFRAAWDAVEIARPVSYSLFTFGESDLPYFLVLDPGRSGEQVSITQGEVKITRPMIITPDNIHPEFENFFDNADEEELAQFLLTRTASFSHLRLDNRRGAKRIVSDSLEEAVAKLNRQLDADDEDRVAILTAPLPLAGLALFKYAAERVMKSAPDNITELRERGFLP